jgi:predicted AAA+ superfamily ATPase
MEWGDRLIGIRGARGCGKTTLLLQRILTEASSGSQCLYASLDHLWFTNHSLEELVDYHVSRGGTHIYLDEVHHFPNWQVALKNLYDDFPGLHIVYTGSSLLRMEASGGDLSRRQLLYYLPVLSFREFLALEAHLSLPAYPLEQILAEHVAIAGEIAARVPIQAAFGKYLRHGCYPFYLEVVRGFEQRLRQIVNQVLESDYPATEPVSVATIRKTKKMLQVLAESVPQTPNLNQLCAELETDRNQALKMLDALARAGLVSLLSKRTKNLKHLGWPEKILMHDANLMYALGASVQEGTLRETFFLNQLRVRHQVHAPVHGDFLVDGRYLFEVGGRHKSFEQIKDIPDSFLALDELEIGYGNRIPLWLFGFLY